MHEMTSKTPLARVGEVEDISAAVLYLASPAGGFVTGKVLEIDGGLQVPNLDLGLPDLVAGAGDGVTDGRRTPSGSSPGRPGTVGRHAIAGIDARPDLELVGVWVSSPEKVGKDAGELAGLGRELGVAATDDKEALYALEPDCIVHTAMVDDRIFEAIADLTEMVERGINVVSSGPVLLCYPQGLGLDEFVDAIDVAGEKTGASLHVNGIDPGWANDVLPLALTSLSQRIDLVRVSEIADYSTYYQPVVMREIYGFGKPMDDVAMLWQPGILTTAWGPVVRQIAAGLEVELDPRARGDRRARAGRPRPEHRQRGHRRGHHGRRPVPGGRQGRRRAAGDPRPRHPHPRRPDARVAATAGGGRLLPRRGGGRAGDAHRLHPPRRGRRPQRVRDDRDRHAAGQRRARGLRCRAGARASPRICLR